MTLKYLRGIVAGGALLLTAAPIVSQQPTDASSSRAARKEAQAAIPFDALSPESQKLVRRVLGNVTIYRRLPTRVLACDPELHHYLVNHPDILVNVWEKLASGRLPEGIRLVHLEQQSDDLYRAHDGYKTAGEVRFLHRSRDSLLVYADGVYEGPVFLHRVQGRCLLLLRSGYFRDLDGQAFVTCRLDAFIQLDQPGAQVVAKTFQPLVGKAADQSFVEATAFLEALSRITAANPSGADRLIRRLDNVHPDVRQAFSEIALRVHGRSRLPQAEQHGAGVVMATDRQAERTARAQND